MSRRLPLSSSLGRRCWRAALGCALLPAGLALATEPTVLERWHVRYDVERDGRATVTKELHQKILQPQALPEAAAYDFSFLSALQQGSLLEAYTLKPDGRRIDVPPASFQSAPDAGDPARTRTLVRFADVAVGDTVAVRFRIADREAVLPGAFSLAHGFSPFSVHRDSRITVRAPRGLDLRFEAHGLQELPASTQGGSVERQWEYRNPAPRPWSAADEGLWRMEETPVLLASSFASHGDLARAYGARARPLAEPTARVRALAQEVAGGADDARERARLLYEWVSTHIAAAGGACLGLGAMVPQAPDAVLARGAGDCKDQATLLQALLAAVGIRSEQVLLNAGEVYDLPATPVLSSLDHVINYLPDWQLYLDASAPLIPFGHLPAQAYGKNVVHGEAEPALRRIPAGAADANGQAVHTRLRVAADGSARGRLEVEFQGVQAARMRDYLRRLDAAAQRDFVHQWLARSGYRGRGTLEANEPADTPLLAERYALALSFEIDNYLQAGTQGAFVLAPVVDLPLSVVRLAVASFPQPQRPARCYGYRSEETYDIELAPGVAFTRLPPDFQARSQPLRYSGHYERTAQGLRVQRILRDDTPQGVCAPAALQAWVAQAHPIAQSLQGPIYYRLPAALGAAPARARAPTALAAPRAHGKAHPAAKTGRPGKKKSKK